MAQNILSITQLNEYIRGRMDADPLLAQVAVRGEVSNYKLYPSGHHYFTLKDESGALKCVMFKGNALRLRFRPENGMKVIAMGKVTVYPRDGAYQLYCTAMAMDGVGDLYAAFEQLKRKLEAQGLFDPAHKKPLPKYPGTIGIITSAAGAAVHDMLRILRKRFGHGHSVNTGIRRIKMHPVLHAFLFKNAHHVCFYGVSHRSFLPARYACIIAQEEGKIPHDLPFFH